MLFCIFSSKFFNTQLYVQVTKYHERLAEQMLNAIAQFTSAIDQQRLLYTFVQFSNLLINNYVWETFNKEINL